MVEWVVNAVLSQMATYGVLVVAVICVLEGLLVGKLLPAEIIIPSAVVLRGGGLQDVLLILLVAVVASTTGQYILYRVARNRGRKAIEDNSWVRVSETQLDRGERYFDQWGVRAVAGGNILPFIRGLPTVPAAVADLPPRQFLTASAAGSTLYHASVITIVLMLGLHASV